MENKRVLQATSGTHPGRARTVNQDAVLAYVRDTSLGDALGLLVVADGMGGHQAGEVASQMAVNTIWHSLSWMLEQDDKDITQPVATPNDGETEDPEETTDHLEKRLIIAVQEANVAIHEYAQENPVQAGNLGCTVTCAIVYGEKAIIANVGDSRTYLFSHGELQQLTDDHSYVGQLVREGLLQPEEVFDHEQRNIITRALGNEPEVKIDVWSRDLEIGDRLLLCSDGMWEMVRNSEEIAQIMASDTLESAVQQLIDSANSYGGADNIGVVVAELQGADE